MLSIKLLDDYIIKEGDIKPFKIQLLRDMQPSPILDGCTATVIIADKNTILYEEPLTIVDAKQGIVEFTFNSNIGAGTFDCEFIVTNDDDIHLTFPDNGYTQLKITASLSKRPEGSVTKSEYAKLNERIDGVIELIASGGVGGGGIDLDNYVTDDELTQGLDTKQDKLVSGTNIKTINGTSILGSGNITIEGGTGGNVDLSGYATTTQVNAKQDKLVSGTNIKTINGTSILGSGDITITLTTAQINALDGLFKIIAYTENAQAEYNAFKTAFNLSGGGSVVTPTNYTFTINPTPSDAIVKINGVTQKYVTVASGTSVAWEVSKTGYITQTGTNTVTKTETLTISLVEEDVTLTGITAMYNGGDVAVGTDVSTLSGLTVTATYDNGSTTSVIGYTLSGTINEGSNTITVTYEGFTTTFVVTGVPAEVEDELSPTDWQDGVPYEFSIVRNEYVSNQGFKTYTGWSRTSLLPCKGASSFTVNYFDASYGKTLIGNYGIWCDIDGNFIEAFHQSNLATTTVPETAYYVVFSQSDAIMDNIASIIPHA